MFVLYKKGKAILSCKHWEDLVEFVDELKKLNKEFVDRREFVVMNYNEKFHKWNRK